MRSILVSIIILLTGCLAQVKTYQKPDQDFGQFETWCWIKGCEVSYQGPDSYYNQAAFEEVGNAIAVDMYEKGYVQGGDSSDLVLNYFIVVEEDSTSVSDEYEDFITTSLYPRYEKFVLGSLVIDVIDRRKSELLFRSTSRRYMELDPKYDREMIREVVKKALKKLPAAKG